MVSTEQHDPQAPTATAHHRYVIGDPGRAALEVSVGAPAVVAGWPDTVVDASELAGLQIRAASSRGVRHRRDGTPRQDGYSVVRQSESALIVTVCDGVGSFDLSHEAADLAARRIPALLHPGPEDNLRWPVVFADVSAEIEALAQQRSAQMATTVVSAYITFTAHGYRAELAWIGDSAAYLLDGSGWSVVGGSVKTAGDDDAPLTSTTAALPCDSFNFNSEVIEFASGTALFLMTDGIGDPLGSGGGEVGRTLANWWSAPPDKFTFADQAAFGRRSFDDDRTVVGIWSADRETR